MTDNLPRTEYLEQQLKGLAINRLEDCSEVAEDVIALLRRTLKYGS